MAEGQIKNQRRFYKLPVEIACRRDLPASAKLIFAIIADRIGANNDCWPGIRSLAQDSGLNVSTVVECLRVLEAKRIAIIDHRGSGRTNHYQLADKSAWKIQARGKSKRTENPIRALGKTMRKRTENPNITRQTKNQTHISYCPNSEALKLSQLLLDLIFERKPDFRKPNLQVWSKHIDRMFRLDKRTPEQIEAVIRWCQADGFEQINILSTEKLRLRFDQLQMKMSRSLNKRENVRNDKPKYDRNFAGQRSSIGRTVEM